MFADKKILVALAPNLLAMYSDPRAKMVTSLPNIKLFTSTALYHVYKVFRRASHVGSNCELFVCVIFKYFTFNQTLAAFASFVTTFLIRITPMCIIMSSIPFFHHCMSHPRSMNIKYAGFIANLHHSYRFYVRTKDKL